MKSILKIFINRECPGCVEARAVADRARQNFPDLTIEIIDIADTQAQVPEAIFATPTFMIDNRVVCLGNPALDEVGQWLEKATP